MTGREDRNGGIESYNKEGKDVIGRLVLRCFIHDSLMCVCWGEVLQQGEQKLFLPSASL